jgi:hypothetical protein
LSRALLEIFNLENQGGPNTWQFIRVVSKTHFVLTEVYPVDMLKKTGSIFPALFSLL